MKSMYPKFCIPKLYLVTIMAFFGMFSMYILRINLSIVIIDITMDKTITVGNTTYLQKAKFNWSTAEIGFILSLFSYGYLCSPLGGILSTRYGGATMFGLGVALTGFLTLLSPIFIHFNFFTFCVARILEGVFQAFIPPAFISLFVHWAPPHERSRILTYVSTGTMFGSISTYPLCAYIADAFGWEAIFYVTGGISFLWYLLWLLLIRNDPEEDWFISNAERSYLKEQINYLSPEKVVYPWKDILTSMPVWAYINVVFTYAWSYSFITYCLPIYIKGVYDMNVKDIGLVSSIPGYFAIVSEILAANLADYLRSHKILTISNVHKSFIFFAQISIIIFLITTVVLNNFIGSIACFSLIRFCLSFTIICIHVSPIDMAPEFSNLIYSLGVTAFSIGSLLSPTLMGYMVPNHSYAEWSRYFIVLGVFNVWCLVIYWIYGSGELQSWAKRPENKKENLSA